MFIAPVFALLAGLSHAAAAFTPSKPCAAYPSEVAALSSCATASHFCTSYLGGPGSYTKTFKSTTTVSFAHITVPSTTVIFTTTDVYHTIFTVSVTTVTSPSPTTITTRAPTCKPTPALGKREPADAAPKPASCKLPKSAPASAISGACNCILAHSTTRVATATKEYTTTTGKATSVSTVYTETYVYTSTYTTTVYSGTTTVYACKPTGGA